MRGKLVDFLTRLDHRNLLIWGIVFAIVFSEIIVFIIDILWDGKLSSELLIAGFITPLLDGLVIVFFFITIIARLKDALSKAKLLSGLLPICASCKKIRDDKGYWNQIESYIRDNSEAEFSYGMCSDCANKPYPADTNNHPGKRISPELPVRMVDLFIKSDSKILLASGIVFAIVFSEIIVLIIDILWDGKLSGELLFAGFITPLLDGSVIVILFSAIIAQLKDALSKVKLLSGLLPICASCKKIRNDKGYWNQIESYVRDNSDAKFSHGICPDCVKKLYPGYAEDY
ncbi:MAG: hypothetical protein A2016_05465 [Elusimicrobia bacterium GWF2_62_30]|nr:MAG: hypothetical protein A2016_05465 [Elusimicrobia bacterium GWF2_62_30]